MYYTMSDSNDIWWHPNVNDCFQSSK